jgi:hypothetical protein
MSAHSRLYRWIALMMAEAQSMISGFSPYRWFRYVYMNYSIVSRGCDPSWFFSSCFFF